MYKYIHTYINHMKKQKPQFHSFINILKKVLTKVFIYKCLKQK